MRVGVALDWLRNLRPISTAASFLFLMSALDIGSSQALVHSPYEETNPFARDANHSFAFWHGLGLKSVEFAFWTVMAFLCYETFRRTNKELGKSVAALAFLLPAAMTMPAVVNNLLLVFKWYQP